MQGCLLQIFVRIAVAFMFATVASILLMPFAFFGNIAKVLVVLAAIFGFVFGPSMLKDDK